jgi:stage II sporulation protein AA (anti-sigma F factor antagonist)
MEEIILQVKFSTRGTTLIVNISGELDHHYAEYVRQKIDGEIIKATTKNIVFNFTGLSFMDSSGIGVIAGRYRNIQKLDGKAAIVSDNQQINRILEMSGLFKIIPLYDTLDQAVSSLHAGQQAG